MIPAGGGERVASLAADPDVDSSGPSALHYRLPQSLGGSVVRLPIVRLPPCLRVDRARLADGDRGTESGRAGLCNLTGAE
jgi:hypothetical protein